MNKRAGAGLKKIAAIETSGRVMSIALCENGRLQADFSADDNLYHSEKIIPAFKNILYKNDWKKPEMLAVDIGPGSFTGIRIGITIARALAQSWGIPLIGVCSLDVLAESVSNWTGKIYCLIDALRNEVYIAEYRYDKKLTRTSAYGLIAIEAFISRTIHNKEKNILCIGSGAELHARRLKDSLGKNICFNESVNIPAASSAARIASRYPGDITQLDYTSVEPLYIRKPTVEERLQKC
ncbi:MAG: tRNA (adenosine(37)-N6)-threonylcarbamoyltransferase complex dimerization subunit type 1 TsaB [bacterium]